MEDACFAVAAVHAHRALKERELLQRRQGAAPLLEGRNVPQLGIAQIHLMSFGYG